MKDRTNKTVLTAILMFAIAVFAVQGQQKSQQQSGSPAMSMDEMMKQCRQHCESTTNMLDNLIRQAEDAKKSGDVARMRSALDNVQQQAQEMKKHTQMCMGMMNMMEHMGGGMHGKQETQSPAVEQKPQGRKDR